MVSRKKKPKPIPKHKLTNHSTLMVIIVKILIVATLLTSKSPLILLIKQMCPDSKDNDTHFD